MMSDRKSVRNSGKIALRLLKGMMIVKVNEKTVILFLKFFLIYPGISSIGNIWSWICVSARPTISQLLISSMKSVFSSLFPKILDLYPCMFQKQCLMTLCPKLFLTHIFSKECN